MIDLNISDEFKMDMRELLNQFLAIKTKNFTSNFYEGKVMENNDPDKQGKCRIQVYGQYDNIPVGDLPWALPDFGILGEFVVPEVGAIVNVYFRNNEKYSPHYTTKIIESDKLSGERTEDYPNTVILFETSKGDYCKLNKKTNELIFRHASGTIVTFVENGDVKLDTSHTSTGNVKITVRGNVDVDSIGTCSVTSQTSISVNAPIIITPPGNVTPTATGGLCCLPIDPITGLPQTGSVLFRT